MMKRICGIFLVFGLGMLTFGCSGGNDETSTGPGPGAAPAAANGGTDASGSAFKEGVDSGRAEDGSDEGK